MSAAWAIVNHCAGAMTRPRCGPPPLGLDTAAIREHNSNNLPRSTIAAGTQRPEARVRAVVAINRLRGYASILPIAPDRTRVLPERGAGYFVSTTSNSAMGITEGFVDVPPLAFKQPSKHSLRTPISRKMEP